MSTKWKNAVDALESLIYKKPPHHLWQKRSWLATLQDVLNILENTTTTLTPANERTKSYNSEVTAVVQKLRDFVVENKIGAARYHVSYNGSKIPRVKVLEIVYKHLKTILRPAFSIPTVYPPYSVSPVLPTPSPVPSITANPVFTSLFAASPGIALEASTNLVAAFFSSIPGGAVPMLPAQCFTMEQHGILQGCLPMESYRKLFFSIPISSQIQ